MRQHKEYVFDWDDNSLIMDTNMQFDKLQDDGSRERVTLTPEDFKPIEDLTGADETSIYRYVDGNFDISYKNFISDIEFCKDTREALIKGLVGPVYDKLREAFATASGRHVNTSRAHTEEGIKLGKRTIMDREKDLHDRFLQSMNKKYRRSFTLYDAIETYISSQKDYGVSSKEFLDRHNGGVYAGSKVGKVLAMKDLLPFISAKYESNDLVSVGFSDDNKGLVDAVGGYLQNYAKYDPAYKNMHFVTYYTEDPTNIIKTNITRKEDIIQAIT